MRKYIMIGLLLMAGLSLNAQTLGNPNFESWTPAAGYAADTLPSNWWSYYCNTVHPTTDACQGTFASKISGMWSCGIAPGIMVNGQAPAMYGDVMQSGTPFSTKPNTISGYYKYNDHATGDSAEVTIILKRWNGALSKRDTVMFGHAALGGIATYSLFSVHMDDRMPGVSPDSIIIMFNSSKYTLWDATTMALPELYVDRIIMPETPMGIGEAATDAAMTSLIFPNPMSDHGVLLIDGEINGYCNPTLEIIDLSGKVVMSEMISSSRVDIAVKGLSKGTYFYRVSRPDQALVAKGKFMVQ